MPKYIHYLKASLLIMIGLLAFHLSIQDVQAQERQLQGQWRMEGREGREVPVVQAQVEAWYWNEWHERVSIGTALTKADGSWELAIPEQKKLPDRWTIELKAYHPKYGQVVDEEQHVYQTSIEAVAEEGAMIEASIDSDSLKTRAFWLHQDIIKTAESLKPYIEPTFVTMQWSNEQTKASHYIFGKNIYLNKSSPRSNTVAIHEIAHAYMYDWYKGIPPVENCSNHYFDRTSSESCAWVEGWASFVALYVTNQPTYTFTNGARTNVVVNAKYRAGDEVEGSIVGVLWRIAQDRQLGMARIMEVVPSAKINDFSHFWSQWVQEGMPVSAVRHLQYYHIYYDEEALS